MDKYGLEILQDSGLIANLAPTTFTQGNDETYANPSTNTPATNSLTNHSLQLLEDNTYLFLYVFSRDDHYYFKHHIVIQMDQQIGDIKNDILDIQRSIVVELEEKLLDVEYQLNLASISIANLDALISLGKISLEYQLIKPVMTEESIIIVKNGRHLLQELTVDNFIPNDIYLTKEKNVAVITGPNGSGKSIYLKQIGLIVYLAHIGSFVPCDRAIVGLTDQIFTRIYSEESVGLSQSSFVIDLNQISKMLKYHTSHSLCLIDEFGKGTNPFDGMALLSSIINHFVTTKVKAVFVTHFTEIINEEILGKESFTSLNIFRMETLETSEEDIYHSQLVPLFKLKLGLNSSSEGILCAQTMGVPQDVIERALYIKDAIETEIEIEPITLHRPSLPSQDHLHILELVLEINMTEQEDEINDKIHMLVNLLKQC